METNVVSAGYDAVFGATPASPTLRRLWREHACGLDFPDQFSHISFVTVAGLTRMAAELRLTPGQTLVNAGCGMGGPALWLARHTGARLIGINLSSAGVSLAGERAAALGFGEGARFAVGAFAETGLDDASVDAIASEDALQYVPDKRAAFVEAARILRPGGRLVFSAFDSIRSAPRGCRCWARTRWPIIGRCLPMRGSPSTSTKRRRAGRSR